MSKAEPRPKSVKKTLNAGRGQVPEYKDGTKAVFHYEVLRPLDLTNGMPESRDDYESIEDTRKGYPHGYGLPMELIFGKKFQLAIFETLLRSMNVDEISQFDVEASELFQYPLTSKKLRDLAHSREHGHGHSHSTHMCAATMAEGTGYPCLDELLKKPSPLRFIFHLLQVHQPEDYEAEGWQLNPEAKLQSVETLKQQGNELYLKKEYRPAIEKYKEALTRLDHLILREKPGDPEWEELDVKNVPLYLNLSICYLHCGDFYESIGAADEVLSRDATNDKALYRKAKALIGTWELGKARESLEKLVAAHPEWAKLADVELQEIKRRQDQVAADKKNICKNMIKGMGGE